MGNKPPGKLRQADLDYFRHLTTFTDEEIRMLKAKEKEKRIYFIKFNQYIFYIL